MLLSFCSPRLWSHSVTKVNSLSLNFSLEQPRVLRWKDLTPSIQIPHPTQARFKFPTPFVSNPLLPNGKCLMTNRDAELGAGANGIKHRSQCLIKQGSNRQISLIQLPFQARTKISPIKPSRELATRDVWSNVKTKWNYSYWSNLRSKGLPLEWEVFCDQTPSTTAWWPNFPRLATVFNAFWSRVW